MRKNGKIRGIMTEKYENRIITTPDPRLRERAEKVGEIDDEVREIVQRMVDLSLEWEKEHPHEISAAMAAPQMGILKRIIIVRDDTSDKGQTSFTALINPEVIRTEGKIVKDYEGCLSVPKIYGLVPRPKKAKIKAKMMDGTEVRIKAEDGTARMLLHEIDHLNGVLFIDHVVGDREGFFELDEEGELVPVEYEKVVGDENLFPEE